VRFRLFLSFPALFLLSPGMSIVFFILIAYFFLEFFVIISGILRDIVHENIFGCLLGLDILYNYLLEC
jgi:hypothetical protein